MNYFINIRDFIYYNRKYFLIVFIILFLVILYFVLAFKNKSEEIVTNENPLIKEEVVKVEDEISTCFVDIKGEVAVPGLYEIEMNKRVMDVIEMAGGLLSDADTSNINLSMKVNDEMVIIVPKKDNDNNKVEYKINNDAEVNKNSNNTNHNLSSKVSINNASLEELMSVSGIGEVKAKKIIEYRNSHGKFASLDELTNVSGIGAKTLEKIKEYLTL
jgi:competence protein ComEA